MNYLFLSISISAERAGAAAAEPAKVAKEDRESTGMNGQSYSGRIPESRVEEFVTPPL
jgi:hypothetical protein